MFKYWGGIHVSHCLGVGNTRFPFVGGGEGAPSGRNEFPVTNGGNAAADILKLGSSLVMCAIHTLDSESDQISTAAIR